MSTQVDAPVEAPEVGVVEQVLTTGKPPLVDKVLIAQLVGDAQTSGLGVDGENGLLAQLTKLVLESALEGEITAHLGYEKHEKGASTDGNARNGTRAKTVLTKGGPVRIEVPRDRAGTFEPAVVAKRRRLGSIEDIVLSLSARGMTHGDISAHLADVYGSEVSKTMISTITDKVLDGMAEWQSRPLDPVYPVVFIDAIHVKVRDGQVANRPIYVALAVTVDGNRDILGLWAGDGGEGAKYWLRADLRRAPDAQQLPVRLPAGLGRDLPIAETRLPGRDRIRGRGQVPGVRRDVGRQVPRGCGRTRGPSSCPSCSSTARSAGSCARRTRSSPSTRGFVRPFGPAGTSPTSRPLSSASTWPVMALDPTGKGRARWTMRWKRALNAFDITFDGRLSAHRR